MSKSCYYYTLVGERENVGEQLCAWADDCEFFHPQLEVENKMEGNNEYTLEQAIENLKCVYEKAEKMECVFKPVAWALYQTWRFADQFEKPKVKSVDKS